MLGLYRRILADTVSKHVENFAREQFRVDLSFGLSL
jgi:hypothetical protein